MSANALPYPGPRRTTSSAALIGWQVAAVVLALACAALGLVIGQAYPIQPTVATILFGACFVFAALRPSWSLVGMLALIPVLAFAPRTGWLLAEEFDLLVLATAGGSYAAWAIRSLSRTWTPSTPSSERPRVSLVSAVLIALFLFSSVVALMRGIDAGGGYRFDWFQNYDDPLNALRVFKSFFWAVLLLPIVVWEARRPQGLDRIALGLTAALALGALAVIRERYAFVGLLDFSDDYRATGSFWEMHIGGAALDGFLALTIPFAIREALRGGTRERFAAAFVVLAMGAYAALVTFSRGVYAAVPLSLLVLVALLHWQRPRVQRIALWPLVLKGLVLVVAVAIGSIVVFRAGGYRAALAVFTLFAATLLVESTSRRSTMATWIRGAVVGVVVAGAAAALATVVWKGPYLAFACAAAAFGATTWLSDRDPSGRWPLLSFASYVWIALAAWHVAGYWGGSAALRDCVIVTALVVAFALASRLAPRPLWPTERRRQLATLGAVAVVAGSVVVFIAGAYMGGRISSVGSDLGGRISHWQEGVGRLRGTHDWLLGKGLGRFPATSLFEAPESEFPGTFHLARRDGETFLALSGPRIKYLGFGEAFRLSQRVELQPGARYRVHIDVRAANDATLHVEICEKQLLYHAQCAIAQVPVKGSLEGWQRRDIELDASGFSKGSLLVSRPVFFAVAVANAGGSIEIRRIRMIGPGGIDTIENGDFADRTARWFSSSDKWHLPFHIKNLALNVLFEQGVVGLALFTLLVGGALLRVVVGRARNHPDAPFIAASLVGFLGVGAFDTLLDMPRVAFMFFFVVMLALVVRNPALRGATPDAVPTATTTPGGATAPDLDAAAARAERRRTAFGDRRTR